MESPLLSYFTTSFHPTGNRYFDIDALCNDNDQARPFTSTNTFGNKSGMTVTNATATRIISAIYRETLPSTVDWIVGNPFDLEFLVVRRDGVYQRMSFGNNENQTFATRANNANNEAPQPLVALASPTLPLEPVLIPTSTTTISPPSKWSPVIPILVVRNNNSTTTTSNNNSTTLPSYDGAVVAVDGYLYINENQQVTQTSANGQEDVTSPSLRATIVDPLLDGYIVYSPSLERWALFGRSTRDRYLHGILGDFFEGFELHVLYRNAATGRLEVEFTISLEDTRDQDGDAVFEQLTPMWADVNGDGIDDIVTTLAKSRRGASLRVYIMEKTTSNSNRDFELRVQTTANSRFIGLDDRWLHQLAVGPFGPPASESKSQIVEMRTPHIGGHIRYYGYDSSSPQLDLITTTGRTSLSSHDIDSRNIDMAAVADFNGDGIVELVLQTRSGGVRLEAVQQLGRNDEGDITTVRPWSLRAGSPMSSNLAVSCSNNNNSSEIHLMWGTQNRQVIRVVFSPLDANNNNTPAPPDVVFQTTTSGAGNLNIGILVLAWIGWNLLCRMMF